MPLQMLKHDPFPLHQRLCITSLDFSKYHQNDHSHEKYKPFENAK